MVRRPSVPELCCCILMYETYAITEKIKQCHSAVHKNSDTDFCADTAICKHCELAVYVGLSGNQSESHRNS